MSALISKSILESTKKYLIPTINRLYNERKAGKMPFEVDCNIFNKITDETFGRIAKIKVNDKWWRNLLNQIGHKYIAPDFIQKKAVLKWLSDNQVRDDIKLIAKKCIMTGKDNKDSEIVKRLKISYAQYTGEREEAADIIINVVVAMIISGFFGKSDKKNEPLIGIMQEQIRKIDNISKSLNNQVDSVLKDPHVLKAHTEILEKKLLKILQKRSFVPKTPKDDLEILINRMSDNGNLSYADNSLKKKVYYWAARLNASELSSLDKTKKYIEKYKSYGNNSIEDINIVNALIAKTKGDNDKALQILRDINSSDGRSVFLTVFSKIKGKEAALLWHNEHKEKAQKPAFYTETGWGNLCIILSENKKWGEAADYLKVINRNFKEYTALIWLEGIINIALMLPEDFRKHVLEFRIFSPDIRPLEGDTYEQYRKKAKDCFNELKRTELFEKIDLIDYAEAVEGCLLWLDLTDTNNNISNKAREKIKKNMQSGKKAAEMIGVALSFNIDFDSLPLENYLRERKEIGGLSDNEILAEFSLILSRKSCKQTIEFIRKKEAFLRRTVLKADISSILVDKLIQDKQIETARKTLEERKEEIPKNDYKRYCVAIQDSLGNDQLVELKELYKKTAALIDLKNLTFYYFKKKDWASLQPLMEELFNRERVLKNAISLINCMRRNIKANYNNIIEFLNNNNDLTRKSDYLLSLKAYFYFLLGRLNKAKKINDNLLQTRWSIQDISLDINIAIQSGDWEHFSVIIERCLQNKDKLDSQLLLRLFYLAAETDQNNERAIKLAKLAVNKEPENPNILLEAYNLSVSLGCEDNFEWVLKAKELSNEKGPVRTYDLPTLVDKFIPKHKKKADNIFELFREGKVPLFMAARYIHKPLSSFLIEIPKSNSELSDVRKRFTIPIVSGRRLCVKIKSEWLLGLDISSIATLYHIGMLDTVFSAFEKIAVGSDIMYFFLNERRNIRFHQPSIIKKAEEIRVIIDKKEINVDSSSPRPPKWLIDEVGIELADLLEAAKNSNEKVINSYPIYKVGSYRTAEANLKGYGKLVISVLDFVILMNKKGLIDNETHKKAIKYLEKRDRKSGNDYNLSVFDNPIYFDDLAITYLQDINILKKIYRSPFKLFIHKLFAERNGLRISNAEEAENTISSLDEIKSELRKALIDKKIIFLPRKNNYDDTEDISDLRLFAPTFISILEDAGECDALCIDEAFINQHTHLTDKAGKKVFTISVLDILFYLETNKFISAEERQNAFYKLREAGFAFIPVMPDELENHLKKIEIDDKENIIIPSELRAIKQSIMTLRSEELINDEKDFVYIRNLQLNCIKAIRNIWKNKNVTDKKAFLISEWVWNNIMPFVWDCMKYKPKLKEYIYNNFSACLSLLFYPIFDLSADRYKLFIRWCQLCVIEPLLPANSDLIDNFLNHFKTAIISIMDIEHGKQLIPSIITNQPAYINQKLLEDKKFLSECEIDFPIRDVLEIDGSLKFEYNNLFNTVRKAFKSKKPATIYSIDGKEAIITIENNNVVFKLPSKKFEIFAEYLSILSPDRKVRLKELHRIIGRMEPDDFSSFITKAKIGTFRKKDIYVLFRRQSISVFAIQDRIKRSLATTKSKVEDLAPNSLDYYEKFCGPNPKNMKADKYFLDILSKYRKKWIRKNLVQGLDIALYGALRDDLMPGLWTKKIDSDLLWDALIKCKPERDPFSLIGALDIAMQRQKDERYRKFAEKAVKMLIENKFISGGIDFYELTAELFKLIYNRINILKDSAVMPPYWKQIASCMHARFIISQTHNFKINFTELKKWVSDDLILHTNGHFASLLDLSETFFYNSILMGKNVLQMEVMNNFITLYNRYKARNINFPMSDAIESEYQKILSNSEYAGAFEDKKIETNKKTPENIINETTQDTSPQQTIKLSTKYDKGKDFSQSLENIISEMDFKNKEITSAEWAKIINIILSTSSTSKYKELTTAIVKKVTEASSFMKEKNSELYIENLFLTLMIACECFKNKQDREKWLKEQLINIAYRLPEGKCSENFLFYIRGIKKVGDIKSNIYSRCEAIASCGCLEN